MGFAIFSGYDAVPTGGNQATLTLDPAAAQENGKPSTILLTFNSTAERDRFIASFGGGIAANGYVTVRFE